MKSTITLLSITILIILLFSSSVLAEEQDDISIGGLELEKLANLASGVLALVLFIITFLAYKNSDNKRLVYISLAFLLFSIKGLLTSHELFSNEISWIDPLASFLDFAIILSFFFGVIRK